MTSSNQFIIEFYKTSLGNEPVRNYLIDLKQSKQLKDREIFEDIVAYLKLLAKHGNQLGYPYVKKLKGTELWELRPKSERIIYCMINGNHIYLLHAFTKKSNKTPVKELNTATLRYKHLISQ